MVNLNLLDPILQQKLHREHIILLVRDITAVTFVATAFIAVLLLISRTILSEDLREIIVRANVVSSRHQPVMRSIQDLNIALKVLDGMSDEFTPWSVWLTDFTKTLGPGNTLTTLSINREDKTMDVTGLSRHRDDLLEFKSKLESSGLAQEIEFPLSNLLSKENVEFEFSATLNPEKLK